MQGKRTFYDIENEKNPLTKKIPKETQNVVKRCKPYLNTIKISIFIHIHGEDIQFQRQPKKILGSEKNCKRR